MPAATAWMRSRSARPAGRARLAYDADVASQVPIVAACLGLYVGGLAVVHQFVFGESVAPIMVAVAAATTVTSLAVAVRARRRPVPPRLAHPSMALLTVLAVLACTVHGLLSRQVNESVNFCLVLVAVGLVLLDRRWLAALIALTWASWGALVVAIGGPARSWIQWVSFLLTATLLGAVINIVRRSAVDTSTAALDAAHQSATEDEPTGLSNRRGLALLGTELVGLARRSNEQVHCSFLDVDGLKAINDTRGHQAGDEVILAVAQALRASSRSTDVVARWGGDEFVVIGLGPGVPVETLEARIRTNLDQHHGADHLVRSRRISIGRAVRPPWESGDLESLIEEADRDMYARRMARGHRSLVPFSAHHHSLGFGG